MAQYFTHMESNEGGMNAAAQHFAEQHVREIGQRIRDLENERRFWQHVIAMAATGVCQNCRGEKSVKWLPEGASRGEGWYTSVPCPNCRKPEHDKETIRLQRIYDRPADRQDAGRE